MLLICGQLPVPAAAPYSLYISTRATSQIMETDANRRAAFFTGTTSGLDPISQPWLKHTEAELRPLVHREPQKLFCGWIAARSPATDITTFQTIHGGFRL